MKFSKYLAILIIALTSTLMVSCGKKTPLNEKQLVYAGTWTAPGNIMIKIAADGGGDFKMSNTSVSGGSVEFSDTTEAFKIGLFGIEKNFIVNKNPYSDEGNTVMVVNGITFTKN